MRWHSLQTHLGLLSAWTPGHVTVLHSDPQAGTPVTPSRRAGTPLAALAKCPTVLAAQMTAPDPRALFFPPPFRGTKASKQGYLFQRKHAYLNFIKYKTGRETTISSVLLQSSSLPFCKSLDRDPTRFIAPFTPSPSPGTEEPALKNASARASSCKQKNSNSFHLHLIT